MAQQSQPASVEGSPQQSAPLAGTLVVCTDVGRSRSHNEDNFIIFDVRQRSKLEAGKEFRYSFASPGLLVGVADGMGGHSSGQVASQLCVETLPTEFLKLVPKDAGGDTDWDALLAQAVHATNEALLTTAKGNREYEGMGTTLTSAWLVGSRAIVAQVGDSRAYHLHEGSFTQLTRDQTVLNSVSEVERQALLNTPFENMLLQALGAMTQLDVVITTTELAAGDYLLLCSDGLYRVVSPEQMAEVLKGPEPLRKKAENLIQKANDGGGPDNITVILCEVLTRGAAE